MESVSGPMLQSSGPSFLQFSSTKHEDSQKLVCQLEIGVDSC